MGIGVARCGFCFCCYLLVGFGGYLVCLMILVACGFGLCDCVLNGFWTGVGWWLCCGVGFGWAAVGVGFLIVGSWVLWFCCKLVWGLWVCGLDSSLGFGCCSGFGGWVLVFGFSGELRSGLS